jgi:acetoin utilization protein AcuB
MTKNPISVAPLVSVDQALGIMRKNLIRHLPVLDEGELKGLVTDVQLSSAWFPSLLDDLTVADVMTADPLIVDAEDSVYEAARLLYHHKMTGLLVTQDNRLVGIITLADILQLFVDLLGLFEDSVRLDICFNPQDLSWEDIHHLLAGMGVEVISVALVKTEREQRIYSVRLSDADLEPVKKALGQSGISILD